ncbi:hypothetical protein CEP52_006365 [Fusarium oligoseptatum]|uniref:Uncharacterized protein n=1 Tax=Fusarium oligoseptatum TaxID=2604345 RepID=A0A428TTT4_9HYPO|nr:hypothetical protein CEP52_006365 [Fusarium oligoseptatum]
MICLELVEASGKKALSTRPLRLTERRLLLGRRKRMIITGRNVKRREGGAYLAFDEGFFFVVEIVLFRDGAREPGAVEVQ